MPALEPPQPPNDDKKKPNSDSEQSESRPVGHVKAPLTAEEEVDSKPELELPPKYLKVYCPKCRQMPGFPCMFPRIKNDIPAQEIDFYAVHIVRVMLYEAFMLGTVTELGVGRNGVVYRPNALDSGKGGKSKE
jgi:hypothetical protein